MEWEKKKNLVDFLGRRRLGLEKLLELGQIDSEFNVTLRTSKPSQAMRDIENGLTVSARDLDLRRIDAVRGHVRGRRRQKQRRRLGGRKRRRRWSRWLQWQSDSHELRRKHLRQLTRGADELRHAWRHRQDQFATSAPNLDSTDSSDRLRRCRRKRRRRHRWLTHN
jgi:hypothetical protein